MKTVHLLIFKAIELLKTEQNNFLQKASLMKQHFNRDINYPVIWWDSFKIHIHLQTIKNILKPPFFLSHWWYCVDAAEEQSTTGSAGKMADVLLFTTMWKNNGL